VSLELSSVCVVDAAGKIVRDAKVASEPEALVSGFRDSGLTYARVGLGLRDRTTSPALPKLRHVPNLTFVWPDSWIR
jgi:hypothetical protein